MSGRVLLLAPSHGLGGGIERYLETVEAALQRHAIRYGRLNLTSPGQAGGAVAKLRFIRDVRRAVAGSQEPVRIVLAHRNLLPAVYPAVRLPNFQSATVVVHGCEIWSHRRFWGRWALRRPWVRVVAVSNFTAGALAPNCRANVLVPGVSNDWYGTLVNASAQAQPGPGLVQLVTAFRLQDWREKGLETILAAVRRLGTDQVRLTVCGRGPVPPELAATVARHQWCQLRPDLTDHALARELASADLFVLATRTRGGAAAYGEGFGLVLLESQLAGTPVLAPAYGGSGEAFQPGLTGLSPVDESPAALAGVLSTLVGDQRRRAEMRRAAADWSRRRFEPTVYAEQVVRTLLDDSLVAREAPCAASAG